MPNPQTQNLTETIALLQALRRRNKNQHRRSLWWRWMSMLQRSMQKLVVLLTAEPPNPADLQALLGYQADWLIPRCHGAFENLLADQQFASLGAVLAAVLARFARIHAKLVKQHGRSVREMAEVGDEGVAPAREDGELSLSTRLIPEDLEAVPKIEEQKGREPEQGSSKRTKSKVSTARKPPASGRVSIAGKKPTGPELRTKPKKPKSRMDDIFGGLI